MYLEGERWQMMLVERGNWHTGMFVAAECGEIGWLWMEDCRDVTQGNSLMLNCLIIFQSWEADLSRQVFSP